MCVFVPEKEDLSAELIRWDQTRVPDRQSEDVSVSVPAVLRAVQIPPADENTAEQPGAAGARYQHHHSSFILLCKKKKN